MYHDPALAAATRVTRPPSAVSGGAGFAGFAGLASWTLVARANFLDGPYSALVGLAACALAMIAWSLLIDRVHRSPSTGLDWQHPRPLKITLDISLTKLAGYWLTWSGIAIVYATGRFYWQGNFNSRCGASCGERRHCSRCRSRTSSGSTVTWSNRATVRGISAHG